MFDIAIMFFGVIIFSYSVSALSDVKLFLSNIFKNKIYISIWYFEIYILYKYFKVFNDSNVKNFGNVIDLGFELNDEKLNQEIIKKLDYIS